MNIAELKKIVQDGKNKFKAYDDADKAILQIESLGQAVNDLEASISTLKKEKEKAASDLVAAKEKYDDEVKKCDFDRETAKLKVENMLSEANRNAKDIEEQARSRVEATKNELQSYKAAIDEYKKKAVDAKDYLDSLNEQIKKAKDQINSFLAK